MSTESPKPGPSYGESTDVLDGTGHTGSVWVDAERSLRKAEKIAGHTEACHNREALGAGIAHAQAAGEAFHLIGTRLGTVSTDKARAYELLKWAVHFKQILNRAIDECVSRDLAHHTAAGPTGMPQGPVRGKGGAMTEEDEQIRRKILACVVKGDCNGLRGFDGYAGGSDYRSVFDDLTRLPFKFHKFGNKNGQAVLLFGPPGSGKSGLAEAVAADIHGGFINVSAADLKGRFVGESERSVKILFDIARDLTVQQNGERCPVVVFIDELEGVITNTTDASDSATGILSELNKQLQGVGSTNAGIITLVATNFPNLIPASAISRFSDARLYIGLPTLTVLEEYLYMLFSNMPVAFKANGPFSRENIHQPRTDPGSGKQVKALLYDRNSSPFVCSGEIATDYWNNKIRKVLAAWGQGQTSADGLAGAMRAFISAGDETPKPPVTETWEQSIVSKGSIIPVLALLMWACAWSLRDVTSFWQILKRTCAAASADLIATPLDKDERLKFVMERRMVTRTLEINGKCSKVTERRDSLTPLGKVKFLSGSESPQSPEYPVWSDVLKLIGPNYVPKDVSLHEIWISRVPNTSGTGSFHTVYFAQRPCIQGATMSFMRPSTAEVPLADTLAHAPATFEFLASAFDQVKPSPIDGVDGLISFMSNNGRLVTPGETKAEAISRLRYAARFGATRPNPTVHG